MKTLRLSVVLAMGCALVVAVGADTARLPGVKTPSRNIGCFYVPIKPTMHGNLLCDIHDASYLRTSKGAASLPPDLTGTVSHSYGIGRARSSARAGRCTTWAATRRPTPWALWKAVVLPLFLVHLPRHRVDVHERSRSRFVPVARVLAHLVAAADCGLCLTEQSRSVGSDVLG